MSVLARNATWGGFSAVVRAVAGLLIALLAVKLLGGQQYGQLATMLSVFILYLSLNGSIFTILVTRIRDALASASHPNKAADVFSAATILSLASLTLLGLLTMLLWTVTSYILSYAANGSIDLVEFQNAILAMGMLTALQILTSLNSAIIEGAGRLDLAMKSQLVGPILVMVGLLSCFIFDVPVSFSGYVFFLVCGALVDMCLIIFVRYRLLRLNLSFSRERWVQIWNILKSGATLQAASLMTLFLEPMNKFLLNYFIGPVSVTAYDISMKIIWGIQSLFASAMRVFLHLSGEHGEVVVRAFSRVFALVLVPVLAVHVLAAIFLAFVVHQWVMVGDTQQIMMFFGIATFSNLGMIYIAPLYISLIGRGDLLFILRSQTIVAVTNVLISIALIPLLGLLGAAFGLFCATAYNVIAIYLRHKRIVGESVVLLFTWRRVGRYLVTTLLFIATIWFGAEHTLNYFAASGILIITLIVVKGEPLVDILWARLKVKG